MIRSEKTRNFIIETTAPIFNMKGYSGTSLSDLTQATGLTKGSIYGNFKDKNEVAVEAFKHNYRNLAIRFSEQTHKYERANQKLLAFFRHYRTAYQDIVQSGGCPLVNTATDSDDGNEHLRKVVMKAFEDWIGFIEKIVTKGIERGELKQVDSRSFALRIISMTEGAVLMSKTLRQKDILERTLNQIEEDINAITIE